MRRHIPYFGPSRVKQIVSMVLLWLALGALVGALSAPPVGGMIGFVAGYLPHQKQALVIAGEANERDQSLPRVEVTSVSRSSHTSELQLPGNIQAYYTAPIFARVAGYVKSWAQDIGARVHKGELLAEIDTPDVDQQIEQARADLANAEAAAKLRRSSRSRSFCSACFRSRALANTCAMSWSRFCCGSGQTRSSFVASKLNTPITGPPPTDNGIARVDLMPNCRQVSMFRAASGGAAVVLGTQTISLAWSFLCAQGKNSLPLIRSGAGGNSGAR